MAKYKVGDKVRVRSDLELHKIYYMEHSMQSNSVVDVMLEFAGKIVTIKNDDSQYCLEECPYRWTDEMFEGLAEEYTEFHIYDTVMHKRYGLGTVIEIDKHKIKVDFDEVPYDRPHMEDNILTCSSENLTLVEAYVLT